MNYTRLVLAALGGTVASFAFGFLVMAVAPALFEEAHKYPDVFRPKEAMMKAMPFALIATLISTLVVAIIFAMMQRTGVGAGTRLGLLVGVFAVCNVMHNYANLNIGSKLAMGQAAAYFVQWAVVCIVISLIYKPLATP